MKKRLASTISFLLILGIMLIALSACGKCEHTDADGDLLCDKCGEALTQRKDDTPEAGKKRIATFHEQSEPLVDYYEEAGNIAHIDGATGLDNVFADIVKALGE